MIFFNLSDLVGWVRVRAHRSRIEERLIVARSALYSTSRLHYWFGQSTTAGRAAYAPKASLSCIHAQRYQFVYVQQTFGKLPAGTLRGCRRLSDVQEGVPRLDIVTGLNHGPLDKYRPYTSGAMWPMTSRLPAWRWGHDDSETDTIHHHQQQQHANPVGPTYAIAMLQL